MSDNFFLGDFFFEKSFVTAALQILFLLFSLFPSMFYVSSLILYNTSKTELYRPFAALFAVNHPDVLFLDLMMVYFGRAFEFHRGWLPALILLIVSAGVAIGTTFIPWKIFDQDAYVLYYSMLVPAAFCSAAIFHTVQTWSGMYRIRSKLGAIVVLMLAMLNKCELESVVYTGIGAVIGAIVGSLGRIKSLRFGLGK